MTLRLLVAQQLYNKSVPAIGRDQEGSWRWFSFLSGGVMGIRFLCYECDRKLNVKDFLAGKRGICPHCGASVRIPLESQLPSSKEARASVGVGQASEAEQDPSLKASISIATESEPSPSIEDDLPQAPAASVPVATPVAKVASDPIEADPDAIWYVRPPSGGQYGPADGDVMRRWITEKRVSAEGLVWREGWAEWKKGRDVFPQLSGTLTPPADPIVAEAPSEPESVPAASDSKPSAIGSRKKQKQGIGIAAIIVLGVLIAVLTVTLIVIVANKS